MQKISSMNRSSQQHLLLPSVHREKMTRSRGATDFKPLGSLLHPFARHGMRLTPNHAPETPSKQCLWSRGPQLGRIRRSVALVSFYIPSIQPHHLLLVAQVSHRLVEGYCSLKTLVHVPSRLRALLVYSEMSKID